MKKQKGWKFSWILINREAQITAGRMENFLEIDKCVYSSIWDIREVSLVQGPLCICKTSQNPPNFVWRHEMFVNAQEGFSAGVIFKDKIKLFVNDVNILHISFLFSSIYVYFIAFLAFVCHIYLFTYLLRLLRKSGIIENSWKSSLKDYWFYCQYRLWRIFSLNNWN